MDKERAEALQALADQNGDRNVRIHTQAMLSHVQLCGRLKSASERFSRARACASGVVSRGSRGHPNRRGNRGSTNRKAPAMICHADTAYALALDCGDHEACIQGPMRARMLDRGPRHRPFNFTAWSAYRTSAHISARIPLQHRIAFSKLPALSMGSVAACRGMNDTFGRSKQR